MMQMERKALLIVFVEGGQLTDWLSGHFTNYGLRTALAGCDAQFWLKCQYTLITAYIMT